MTEEIATNLCELKNSSRDKLITDVKAVVADAEAYLDASVGQAGEAYAAARMKLENTLDAARAQVAEAHHVLAEKTRAAARATDTYVHEKLGVHRHGRRRRFAAGIVDGSSLKRVEAGWRSARPMAVEAKGEGAVWRRLARAQSADDDRCHWIARTEKV